MSSSSGPGRQQAPALAGPGMRLLRLWLAAAPLAMLGLAALFAVLAAGGENWGLLAAMVLLGLVAVVLFAAQAWVIHKYLETATTRGRQG